VDVKCLAPGDPPAVAGQDASQPGVPAGAAEHLTHACCAREARRRSAG